MNYVVSVMLVAGLLTVTLAPDPGPGAGSRAPGSEAPSFSAPDDVVQEYCVSCHNERTLRGNLSLEGFTLDAADGTGAISEMMIQKLRADMMPPPGARRPSDDSLLDLVESLEAHMHDAAAAYLNAAAEISRLAVGDLSATASETQYRIPRWVSQTERVDGAPFGTRGGTSVVHNFPADGQDLERLLSVPTVHSSSTRAMSMRAAKKCDRVQATERAIEQEKYEQAHND